MLRITSALLFCALYGAASFAASGDVHEYKLDNGLKIIVKEDHRAPVVVSQIWYKVGSSYEHGGITGVSHALEHMMFNGTKQHGPKEFSRIIAENGGRENAFTSRDYTAFFQQLDRNRLEVSFDLESDRMRNLLLLPEEYAKEIRVVKEERRMRTDDDPQALTYEQFAAVAYLNGPYRIPTIGWMTDLDNLKVSDLRSWYDTWYAPNNATLVVVGDVDPEEVLKLAKRHFGPIPARTLPEVKPRVEVEQIGTRRLTVKVPAELPYLLMGYKVPVLKTAERDWEPYALEVLAAILNGGDSARLSKHLIREQQVAAEASAEYSSLDLYTGMFLLDGTPAQGRDAAALEKALREQVDLLRDKLVDDEELKRVKAQVVASDVYQRDSTFYQAMQIGTLESVGLPWQLMDQFVTHVRAISAEQVREVARKYLVDDHLTVAVLDPLPITEERRQASHDAAGGPIR